MNVIVAIDFGTSRSGYAYALSHNPKVIYRTNWPGQPVPYIKTLTHLLYYPDQQVSAWGWEAKKRFADMQCVIEAGDYNLFQNFKMLLHEAKNRTKDGLQIKTRNGQTFLVRKLIADYLKILKDEVVREITNASAQHLKEKDIFWCLTVPAIWTDADKQLMRQAAQDAGLISSNADDADRLLLVLEPEAAATYCREEYKFQLKPSTSFMVIDCGGGTVDITVHKVVDEEGRLIELAEGTGGAYGSKYIDDCFLDYLNLKLTTEVIESYEKENPVEYLEMMDDWERIKCDFDPQTSFKTISLSMRVGLYTLLNTEYQEILKRLSEEQKGEDKRIYIERQTMIDIFRPTLQGLVNKVQEQFQKLANQKCDNIFLVGGFSKSPIVQQWIDEIFGAKVDSIVTPSLAGGAIVGGAVLLGLKHGIRARYSRFTYGCKISDLFNPELDKKEKMLKLDGTKEIRAKDIFDVFINVGQKIDINEKITKIYYPENAIQDRMIIEFYATQRKNVRYIDENEVRKIGEIVVEMPNIEGGFNRKVEVSMCFGQTEIKVTAKDINSDYEYETRLIFI